MRKFGSRPFHNDDLRRLITFAEHLARFVWSLDAEDRKRQEEPSSVPTNRVGARTGRNRRPVEHEPSAVQRDPSIREAVAAFENVRVTEAGYGKGPSKKVAEQEAAREALAKLGVQPT